jgi:hypothetical protein
MHGESKVRISSPEYLAWSILRRISRSVKRGKRLSCLSQLPHSCCACVAHRQVNRRTARPLARGLRHASSEYVNMLRHFVCPNFVSTSTPDRLRWIAIRPQVSRELSDRMDDPTGRCENDAGIETRHPGLPVPSGSPNFLVPKLGRVLTVSAISLSGFGEGAGMKASATKATTVGHSSRRVRAMKRSWHSRFPSADGSGSLRADALLHLLGERLDLFIGDLNLAVKFDQQSSGTCVLELGILDLGIALNRGWERGAQVGTFLQGG